MKNKLIIAVSVIFLASFLFSKNIGSQKSVDKLEALKIGGSYFIFVKNIEVLNTNPSNDNWDSDDDPPDIFYKAHFNGSQIYKSTSISNTIFASYSPVKGGITDTVTTKNLMEYLEMTSFRYSGTLDQIEIDVYDKDLVSDDHIGRVILRLDAQKTGRGYISEYPKLEYYIIDQSSDMNIILRDLGVVK